MTDYRSQDAGRDTTSSFQSWTGGRTIRSIGTNAGSDALPFQNWRKFKEAFAPELIQRAVAESPIPVHTCLDPFGGSGTTGLACQFLGVRPTVVEVNPFLADLIRAKLCQYQVDGIAQDFRRLIKVANNKSVDPSAFFANAPETLVQPGVKKRWIFDRAVAARIAAYSMALTEVRSRHNRRLFRVLLAGIVVSQSNVLVSGKGRRYRTDWERNRKTAGDLDQAFVSAVESAVNDIVRYADRPEKTFTLVQGDSRSILSRTANVDISIFSPPYPNSFDYTDVYNVELWALGYLKRSADNLRLRRATLSSHVQIKRLPDDVFYGLMIWSEAMAERFHL